MSGPASQFHIFRLLLRCAEQRCSNAGRTVHGHVIKTGFWAEEYLANSITNMYTKCGQLSDATRAFSHIRHRDVISYNCLINAYAKLGFTGASTAAGLFRNMHSECVPRILPNAYTFVGLFTAVSHDGIVFGNLGLQAHGVAAKTADCNNVFLATSLLNMYCKMGFLSDARKVFDRMSQKNSVTWTAIISGYATEKHGNEAFELFVSMLREGSNEVNEFVISSVLSAVSFPGCFKTGSQIHGLVVKNGLVLFVYVENALVTFYAKAECMDDALMMFHSSSNKNYITWSAMITGCAQNGNSKMALELFSQIQFQGIGPTEFALVGALNACSNMMALVEGKQAHSYLIKLGYERQVYVKSALVDMYAKCGSINDARKGFDELHKADVILWTTMLSGYVQNGEHEEALLLYSRMMRDGILPNYLTLATLLRACASLAALEQGKQLHVQIIKFRFGMEHSAGTALSTMYAKCGNLEDCIRIFQGMRERDIIAWNSIISAFSQNGRGKDALQLFDQMIKEGTNPDGITFINILSACSHVGLVDRGWTYFKSMVHDYGLEPELEHYACMVDMLSRAGMLIEAKEFIETVPIDHGMCLWRIVLGACRSLKNYNVGVYAGERLLELGCGDSAVYILLANIYASQKMWDDVERVRQKMRLRGVGKDAACSWLEIKSRVHVFVKSEMQHPEMGQVYAELATLDEHLRDEGYEPLCTNTSHGDLEVEMDSITVQEPQLKELVSV